MTAQELLLIAGRSGVGKSTVAFEVSRQLSAAGVAHCLIEGDNLSYAHPAPAGDPHRTKLTEDNLRALWGNYAARGYHRLIYTNTVSVLEVPMIERAIGGSRATSAVQLVAGDSTIEERLGRRESGAGLAEHLARSAVGARRLDEAVGSTVVRVETDDREVADVAAEIVRVCGWGRSESCDGR